LIHFFAVLRQLDTLLDEGEVQLAHQCHPEQQPQERQTMEAHFSVLRRMKPMTKKLIEFTRESTSKCLEGDINGGVGTGRRR
jgi:hypothetical protein